MSGEEEVVLRVEDGGVVTCLWTDHLDLPALGHVEVTRASSVEWSPDEQGWTVTRPDGRRIGGTFRDRREALAYEVRVLQEELARGSA